MGGLSKSLTAATLLLLATTAAAQPPPRPQRPPDPRTAAPAPKAPTTSYARSKALFDQAVKEADAKRYPEALRLYDEALRLDPENDSIFLMRALTKQELGDCKGAIVDFDKYEDAFPIADLLAITRFYAARAECHFDLKDYAKAIADFKIQVEEEPADHRSWSMLGYAYSLAKQHAEALPPLRKAMEIDPRSVAYVVMMGEALDRAGKYEEGLTYHRRALTMDPNFVGAHRAMALDYVSMNRLADAKNAWQTVLRLNPNDPDGRKMIALIDADLAKAAAPAMSTTAAPASAPRTAIPANASATPAAPAALDGAALYRLGRFPEALTALNAVLQRTPNDWQALRDRAMVLDRLDRPIDAIADFNRALALNPADIATYVAFAEVYSARGDRQQAIRLLEAAQARSPQNTQVQQALAAVRPAAGAPRTLATAPPPPKSYPPVDPRSSLGRGIALYNDTELQPAVQALLAATRENPNDARGFIFLGAAYYKLGMTKESNEARDRALQMDPGVMALVTR